jgi:hypothetical protein
MQELYCFCGRMGGSEEINGHASKGLDILSELFHNLITWPRIPHWIPEYRPI